ncbi:MAG: DoxX family protein [Bdellovibrionota bacterium]
MERWLVDTSPFFTDLAVLLIRTFVGICFVVHALGKLGLVGPGGSLAGFAEWLGGLGVPAPRISAYGAFLSELMGGAFLAAGLFARPASFALFGTMLVAGLVGHRGGGYLITNNPPGAEYTINLAAVCLALFLTGPGAYSLDAVLF